MGRIAAALVNAAVMTIGASFPINRLFGREPGGAAADGNDNFMKYSYGIKRDDIR